MSGNNVLRPLRNLVRGIRKSKALYKGWCNACSHRTIFFEYGALTLTNMPYRNDLPCLFCKSVARQRALIASLCGLYDMDCPSLMKLPAYLDKKQLQVYNAAAQGTIHSFLRTYSRYSCSEFFPNVDCGSVCQDIRCEDLQSLTFPDNSFDIVITEDVLEHVCRPLEAFKSIHRVLKAGGYHVFTVPVYAETTTVRIDTATSKDVFLLPPIYHGDPLRSEGALAYNDFGLDITTMADACGFDSRVVRHNAEDNRYMCGHVIVSRKLDESFLASC